MRTIVDGLEAAARRHADRLAVQDGAASLTYRELADRARRIAAAFAARLERPGPVAVLAPFDLSSACAVLGVLAAGRGVIPLDADHPDARNRLIGAHSAAAGVVTIAALAERARALFDPDVTVVELDRLDLRAPADAPRGPGPDDLAYVLYTSGSTGAPKGVFCDHRSLLADLGQYARSFAVTPEDRVAVFYPPAVFAGLRVFLGGVLAGASAHLLAPGTLGAQGVVREIQARELTVFHSSATLLRHVAAAAGSARLESLRLLTLGGDRVDWSDYDLFRRLCRADARCVSHLGATECSLYAQWEIEPDARGEGGSAPAGRIGEGFDIALQDPDGAPVPEGEIGEIVVWGRRLARGYWRDPARTAEAFSASPNDAELRAYRTGDLGRLRADGLLEHVGRRDQQIKLRGFRVELGEIESALRACSGVEDGAVVTRPGADGAVRSLAAYIELAPGTAGLLPRHLQAMLAQRLPDHMVPAEVVILEALPWLANFKVDRQRLAALDRERAGQGGADRGGAITDPLTAEIARVFEAVLDVEAASPEDDIQSLGGDSLQVVDIARELSRRLGVEIPAEAIEISCAIRDLPARLGLRADQAAE